MNKAILPSINRQTSLTSHGIKRVGSDVRLRSTKRQGNENKSSTFNPNAFLSKLHEISSSADPNSVENMVKGGLNKSMKNVQKLKSSTYDRKGISTVKNHTLRQIHKPVDPAFRPIKQRIDKMIHQKAQEMDRIENYLNVKDVVTFNNNTDSDSDKANDNK